MLSAGNTAAHTTPFSPQRTLTTRRRRERIRNMLSTLHLPYLFGHNGILLLVPALPDSIYIT